MNLNDSQRNTVQAELEQVAIEAYNRPREDLRATTMVPKQQGIREWAETFVYPVFSKTGVAKFVSDYGEDIPVIKTFMAQDVAKIKTLAVSYGFSEEEIMAWLTGTSGRDLDREGSEEARVTIDEKVDMTILMGDDLAGYKGFFNNSNVSHATIPATGTGDTTTFATKTLDQITASIQAVIDVVTTATRGPNGGPCIKPDSIVLPTSVKNWLSTKKTNGETESWLTVIKKLFESQGIKNWYDHELLEGIGASSANRMIAYKNDVKHIAYVLPIPFKQKNAQEKALGYAIPCYARCGGTVFKRLKSIAYGDGV